MVSSKDHKRAHDNDKGLNTGGMGTIAPNPYYTDEIAQSMHGRNLPAYHSRDGRRRAYRSRVVLYFGLMLTPNGPKVIEYNCRFGDPETQVVLPLLKTDLMEIFLAVSEERLSELDIQWDKGAAACVVMASGVSAEISNRTSDFRAGRKRTVLVRQRYIMPEPKKKIAPI